MNILKKLGYITTKEYLAKEKELQETIQELQLKIFKLERLTQRETHIIDIDIADPTPDIPEARKAYVANVAGFFFDVLEKKLKHMLSNVHTLMEDCENDDKRNHQLAGAAYSLREMLFWGKSMVNEHVSYLVPQTEITEEEIDELKEKIK